MQTKLAKYLRGTRMVQTRIFNRNGCLAVKLPKNAVHPEDIKLVDVVAVEDRRAISPSGTTWDEWFENNSASVACMGDRSQPCTQVRESLNA